MYNGFQGHHDLPCQKQETETSLGPKGCYRFLRSLPWQLFPTQSASVPWQMLVVHIRWHQSHLHRGCLLHTRVQEMHCCCWSEVGSSCSDEPQDFPKDQEELGHENAMVNLGVSRRTNSAWTRTHGQIHPTSVLFGANQA